MHATPLQLTLRARSKLPEGLAPAGPLRDRQAERRKALTNATNQVFATPTTLVKHEFTGCAPLVPFAITASSQRPSHSVQATVRKHRGPFLLLCTISDCRIPSRAHFLHDVLLVKRTIDIDPRGRQPTTETSQIRCRSVPPPDLAVPKSSKIPRFISVCVRHIQPCDGI